MPVVLLYGYVQVVKSNLSLSLILRPRTRNGRSSNHDGVELHAAVRDVYELDKSDTKMSCAKRLHSKEDIILSRSAEDATNDELFLPT